MSYYRSVYGIMSLLSEMGGLMFFLMQICLACLTAFYCFSSYQFVDLLESDVEGIGKSAKGTAVAISKAQVRLDRLSDGHQENDRSQLGSNVFHHFNQPSAPPLMLCASALTSNSRPLPLVV